MRIVCLLYSNPTILQAIAEASLQWTPQVAISHEAVFLEIGKCRKLYREQTLLGQLRALNKRFGLKPKVSMANDVPTALAMARFQISQRQNLPIEAVMDYFSPWEPTDVLNSMIALLKKLGILKLEDFLSLPVKTLSSRFGKEAIWTVRKIKEADQILWPPFVPEKTLIEKLEFETGELLTHLEPLLFSAKTIIDRAMIRLKGRGKKASVIKVVIEQEAYSTVKEPERSCQINLSMPQGKVSGILPIIKDRLEAELVKSPLTAPIISIAFQILEWVPAKEAERDFFTKKEEEEEAWGSLVSRLSDKLGKEKVFIASPVERYLPENGWTKTLNQPLEASLPIPSRPLRLLKSPKKITISGKNIYADRKKWEIEEMEGPERLSGEWWFESFDRDYFKVTSRSGEALWIYKTPGTKQYYLHGIFD
jgi:protein ImuB